ncbi:MAG: hypothetical protein K6B72_08580 [Lachnospiraceae bacterium]|jgi:hypothetical protein|nr:hypothetical protein [Lachnospiraceae bacterium]
MNNSTDREKLITALASAMGQGDYSSTKYSESKYDPTTGTLFCQGYIISKSTVDEALEYFKKAKLRADQSADADNSMRNVALYYQTAIEAIIMMQKKASADGGRVIAKNDGR